MPNKTKKPQRNAMYWFMQELRPQLVREGRVPTGVTMPQLVQIAHPLWKNLSPQEKERFERKAREEKFKARNNPVAELDAGNRARMDNVGNYIAERKDPIKELQARRERDIKMARSRWPKDLEEVKNFKFYIISFEYMCETEDKEYPPLEVGVIEYSLNHGISKMYHKFIDAGKVPLGQRFNAQQHSDDYHQIPFENFEKAENDYRGLYIQLENFVNPNGEKKEYPPLYCYEDQLEVVEYSMEWIHQRACMGMSSRLSKIHVLEDMVAELSKTYSPEDKKVDVTAAKDILSTSVFDFEKDTRCDFHEELDIKYCALYNSKKAAYAISDHFSPIFDFPLTPRHVPTKTEGAPYVVREPSSQMAFGKPRPPRRPQPVVEEENNGPFASRDYRIFGGAPVVGKPDGYLDRRNVDAEDDFMVSHTQRRPHMPAGFGPVQKEPDPPDTEDPDEFPTLGAPAPVKYAGKSQAPDASKAPMPPPTWKQGASSPARPQPADLVEANVPCSPSSKLDYEMPAPRKTLREAVAEQEATAKQEAQQSVNDKNPWGIQTTRAGYQSGTQIAPGPRAARPRNPGVPTAWSGRGGPRMAAPRMPNSDAPSRSPNVWAIPTDYSSQPAGDTPSDSESTASTYSTANPWAASLVTPEPSEDGRSEPDLSRSNQWRLPTPQQSPAIRAVGRGMPRPGLPSPRPGLSRPPAPAGGDAQPRQPAPQGIPKAPFVGIGRGIRPIQAPVVDASRQLSTMFAGVGRGRGMSMRAAELTEQQTTKAPPPGLGRGLINGFGGITLDDPN